MEKDEAALLKSPLRQSLFRACKSPLKPVKDEPTDKKNNCIAMDLLDTFPDVKDNFDIIKMVGEGTFSKVYLAKLKDDPSRMFAFKHLVPTSSPERIENELKCLQKLGDKCNVLGIKTSLRKNDHIVFVLPYFPHRRFNSTIDHFSTNDIKHYMKNLFIALKHVHSHNIIHRDVKPNNFLYCKDTDSFALIDFGLAMPVPGTKHFFLSDYTSTVLPQNGTKTQPVANKTSSCKHSKSEACTLCKNRPRQKAPRAGTPGFRSPEVLLKYPNQTTAVDMWSAGIILLCLLSKRYPFFKAKDDMEALSQIIVLFGTKKIKKMAESIGKFFDCTPPVENVDSLKIVCESLSKRSCSLHNPSSKPVKRKNTESELTSPSSAKRRKSETVHRLNEERENDHDVSLEMNTSTKEGGVERSTDKKINKRTSKSLICSCVPDSVYDLLEKLLELQPDKRLSAEESLKHPFVVLR